MLFFSLSTIDKGIVIKVDGLNRATQCIHLRSAVLACHVRLRSRSMRRCVDVRVSQIKYEINDDEQVKNASCRRGAADREMPKSRLHLTTRTVFPRTCAVFWLTSKPVGAAHRAGLCCRWHFVCRFVVKGHQVNIIYYISLYTGGYGNTDWNSDNCSYTNSVLPYQ